MTSGYKGTADARAPGMRYTQGLGKGAKQPQRRGGKGSAENRDVLGKLGHKVLELLAQNDFTAVEMHLGDMACKGEVTKAFYHSVMHACQTTQELSSKVVLWLADQMEQRGLKPNVVTFNCMIGSCLKDLDIETARKLWEEMLTRGLKPNRITYNIMISSSAKCQEPTAAEDWLYRMIEDGVKPCTVSYTAVIDAFAKLGHVGSAEAWFVQMEKAGEVADDVAFNSVINSCAKAGQLDRAEYWVQCMIKAGIQPDRKTYNCLMHACGRCKLSKPEGRLYAKMAAKGSDLDAATFHKLIDICAKSNKCSLAYCWLKALGNGGFEADPTCYDCIIHACMEKCDVETMKGIATMLISKGLSPSTTSYKCMVATFLQAGEPHLAVEWFTRMRKSGNQPDTLTQAMLSTEEQVDCGEQAPGPNISASIRKALEAGSFYKVQNCVELLQQQLRRSLPGDLVEEIIDSCLLASSRAPTRCSTSTSSDFRSVMRDRVGEDLTLSPETACAQSLMQCLLPNIQLSFNASDAIIISF